MKRIDSIDAVKGLCLLLVFVGHCNIDLKVNYFWCSFYMSAFFLFSGYLFKYKNDVKSTVLHKIKTLLLPYYIWCLVPYSVMGIIDIVKHNFNASEWLKNVWLIIICNHHPFEFRQLWFIYALFTTEILWIIIDTYVKKPNHRYIIIAILFIIGIVINTHNLSSANKFAFLRIESAVIMLPMFALGRVAKKKKDTIEQFILRKPLFIAYFTVWAGLTYLHNLFLCEPISIAGNTFGIFPLFYINAILGTLIAVNISFYLLKITFPPIRKIMDVFVSFGQNSIRVLVNINLTISIIRIIVFDKQYFLELQPQQTAYFICFAAVILQYPIIKLLSLRKLQFLFGKF